MMFRAFMAVAATVVITSVAMVMVTNRRIEEAITNDDWIDALLDGDILPFQ